MFGGLYWLIGSFLTASVSSNTLGPAELVPYTNDNLAVIEKLHDLNPIVENYALNVQSNLTTIANCGKTILDKIAEIKERKEICISTSCSAKLETVKKTIEQGAYNLRAVKNTGKRPKRYWESAGEWLHDSFGVLTATDMKILSDTSENIRTQQKAIIAQVSKEKQYLMGNFDHLENLANTINNLSSETQDRLNRVTDIINQADQDSDTIAQLENAARHFLDASIGCIDLIVSKRVTGKMLNLTQLDEIYSSLRSKLAPATKIAIDSLLELSIQRPATIRITNNILSTLINVPIVSSEVWEAFHVRQQLVIKDKKIVTLHIEEQLEALTPDNRTSRIDSQDDCYETSSELFACLIKNPIKFKDSCVSSLIRTKSADSYLCDNLIMAAEIQSDTVVRLDSADILVVPESLTNISLNCLNQWQFSALLKAPSIIKVFQPCTLLVNDLMFIETPTKAHEAEIKEILEIKISPSKHKHIDEAPPLPKISETRMHTLEQLGKQIKQLNDEEINTPFITKVYRRQSTSAKVAFASVGTIIILCISVYCYCKFKSCCCCC